MIYDTFPFFNELELLEVRLHELDPVVDRFVLAEANRTHSNQPKPLHFAENRERFARFLPKIIPISVYDCPDTDEAWTIEKFQRNTIGRGLTACRPDDIILHSDIDEIPRASTIGTLRETMQFRSDPAAKAWSAVLRHPLVVRLFRNLFKKHHPLVRVLQHRLYYYFLNAVSESLPWWDGTRAIFYRDFTCARELRMWKGRRIPGAGWHFSYMGGVERVRQKLQAFAHQEYNRPEFTDRAHLDAALREGRWALGDEHRLQFVALDESYPRFIRENAQRFEEWLRPTP